LEDKEIKEKVVKELKGKLSHLTSQQEIVEEIKKTIKLMFIEISDEKAESIAKELASFGRIQNS
jgi:hypothetical protein